MSTPSGVRSSCEASAVKRRMPATECSRRESIAFTEPTRRATSSTAWGAAMRSARFSVSMRSAVPMTSSSGLSARREIKTAPPAPTAIAIGSAASPTRSRGPVVSGGSIILTIGGSDASSASRIAHTAAANAHSTPASKSA